MSKRKDREEAMERVRHQVQTVGIEAASKALIDVCNDPKAPAPARATAGTTLFRAAGFFDPEAKAPAKEPHEMSFDELRAQDEQLGREREAMLRDIGDVEEHNAFD